MKAAKNRRIIAITAVDDMLEQTFVELHVELNMRQKYYNSTWFFCSQAFIYQTLNRNNSCMNHRIYE